MCTVGRGALPQVDGAGIGNRIRCVAECLVGRVRYLERDDGPERGQGQQGDCGGRTDRSQSITPECRNEGIPWRAALERLP